MTEHIENLAKGDYFYMDLKLLSDVELLSLDLYANRKYEDTFTVYNNNSINMTCHAISTDPHITIKSVVVDNTKASITFIIDTYNLHNNEILDGDIKVFSNAGRKNIHFIYSIKEDEEDILLSKLDTIENYRDLFVTNFDFAYNIFGDKRLYKAKFLRDEKTLCYYETIRKGHNKNIAIIEFFKSMGVDISERFIDMNDSLLSDYLLNSNISIDSPDDKNEKDVYDTKKIVDLINKINDKDLIEMIAIQNIRKGYHDIIAFNIYFKTLLYGSTINNLYKMILVSFPEKHNQKLPLYVYRYFYEDKSFTFEQKKLLYKHIIQCFHEEDEIYKLFFDEICQYALSEIYKNSISEDLLNIYNKILSTDIVNENNATNILYLVRNYKINVKNKNISSVIIKYVETNNETRYDIKDGYTYVPIFFDSKILLFEDKNGCILYNVDYDIKAMFDLKEVEKKAISLSKDNGIYLFSRYFDIINKDNLNEEEIDVCFNIIDTLNLSYASLYKIISIIINNLFLFINDNRKLTYKQIGLLKDIDYEYLDISDKKKILKIMLEMGEIDFVYHKIERYDIDLMRNEDKLSFFIKYLIKYYNEVPSMLRNYMYDFTVSTDYDDAINPVISYLIGNTYLYNDDDFKLLDVAINHNIDIRQFINNLVYNMLNINISENIDYVFSQYIRSDAIDINFIKAYLTKKSYDLFFNNEPMNETYLDILSKYIDENINDIDNIPTIYLLAFTKYISTIPTLNNNDLRRLLIVIVDYMIKKDLVFGYFKDLNKHITIDDSIMNKEYIEYNAKLGVIPRLKIIINNKEKDVELLNIYNHIYQRSIHVYKNEFIVYKIYNQANPEDGILKEGSISYTKRVGINPEKNITYDAINNIITNFSDNKINDLKSSIIDLQAKEEVVKNLFNI